MWSIKRPVTLQEQQFVEVQQRIAERDLAPQRARGVEQPATGVGLRDRHTGGLALQCGQGIGQRLDPGRLRRATQVGDEDPGPAQDDVERIPVGRIEQRRGVMGLGGDLLEPDPIGEIGFEGPELTLPFRRQVQRQGFDGTGSDATQHDEGGPGQQGQNRATTVHGRGVFRISRPQASGTLPLNSLALNCPFPVGTIRPRGSPTCAGAVRAARLLLTQVDECLRRRVTFALETRRSLPAKRLAISSARAIDALRKVIRP